MTCIPSFFSRKGIVKPLNGGSVVEPLKERMVIPCIAFMIIVLMIKHSCCVSRQNVLMAFSLLNEWRLITPHEKFTSRESEKDASLAESGYVQNCRNEVGCMRWKLTTPTITMNCYPCCLGNRLLSSQASWARAQLSRLPWSHSFPGWGC